MAEFPTPNISGDQIEAPILRLPPEVRLKIYSYLHEDASATIHDDESVLLNLNRPLTTSSKHVYHLPKTQLRPMRFEVACESYNWEYLLTCRTFNNEARHALPQSLHLRVLSRYFQAHYLPEAVANRHLPHIRTLTIVGRYPLYDHAFDGGKLPSLSRFYLLDELCRSRFDRRQVLADHILPDQLALIQGSHDDKFIVQGSNKLELAKMNWWQNDKRQWLHDVLSRDTYRSFQVILQQIVFLRFTRQASAHESHKFIMLDLLFDLETKELVRRSIRVILGPGQHRDLQTEEEIRSFFSCESQSSSSSVEQTFLTNGL